MTFAARQHVAAVAGGAGVQSMGTMNLGGTSIVSEGYVVAMTLNQDGTISWINQMNNTQTTPVGVAWYSPTTGGVGSDYRARFTLQSGAAWDGAIVSGTLYGLSSPRQISWGLPAEGLVQAQVLVEITSSGDTTVLGSGTLVINMLDEY